MQKEQKKETTVERETRIRTLWAQEGTFAKSVSNRAGQQPFVFYEGPPTANGLPHVGHAFGRTIKMWWHVTKRCKAIWLNEKLVGIHMVYLWN